MSWLNWHDLLAPTNPYAAFLFGIIVTIVIALSIWFETKKRRTILIVLLSGVMTTILGVGLLTVIGFYQGG
ncbi:hypothetical protein LCL96_07565 [Rossellomorea aquimaris]|uniref:hypothetical protein n=1 Tax=Rossellomorea TaxID=2837508 RepID=UPI001CD1C252|nr:hypothetical protein [Rossellomorea aquimaris]MCA1058786.1 hypothetical protein [Rossellomorea aquimaris]